MRILSLLIISISVFLIAWLMPSPHGTDFKVSCNVCHSPNSWKLDKEIYSYNHDNTKFPLVGQHNNTDCKLCHPTLVFSEANTECASCHKDVHESTVGPDCNRCHTPNSWLVENITRVHQQSRFPLLGVHATADCYQCHKSETFLRFEVVGNECYSCHSDVYLATTQPNHSQSGFSTQCIECHSIYSQNWSGAIFKHNFFPLTYGHNGIACLKCHTSGQFTKIPAECSTCHQADYNATSNPNHSALNFSTVCNECHTLIPGWKPASYKLHDALSFPIYSGKHRGQWTSCIDCHSNTSNYKAFSCTNCHEHNKADMDSKHSGQANYSYISTACLECHPRGNTEK